MWDIGLFYLVPIKDLVKGKHTTWNVRIENLLRAHRSVPHPSLPMAPTGARVTGTVVDGTRASFDSHAGH